MIRATITTDKQKVTFNVPKSYLGKKIEVLMYAVDEIEPNVENPAKKKKPSDFAGTISKKNAQQLLKHVVKSRNEWERNS